MMLSYSQRARRVLFLRAYGAELPHDDALGRRLEGQRDEDPLQVLPLLDDQPRVDLANGLEHQVRILARVLEAVERGPDLIVEIPVPRREPVAKDVKEGEIHLVGAMRIGGMHVRLDLGAVVEQEIEYVVALMLVGADDRGIDGDVVGHQRVGHDALVQAEVFRRVAGIDRGDAGLEFLAVAAGVEEPSQVVLPEDGQLGNRIADPVVGLLERLGAEHVL